MRNHNMLAEMLGFLGDAMSGDPNGKLSPTEYAVERNGRHKQALAAAAKTLPRRMDRDDRLLYEAVGFTFGNEVDRLFVEATFPEGWGTKPTDHYMYTLIVDEQGRRRGQYMYKPDFYDQDASLWSLERRFQCGKDYSDERNDDEIVVIVKDTGREIHRTKVHRLVALKGEKAWETRDRVEQDATAEARAWLEARFPECWNPLAYWSLPSTIDLTAFPEGCSFEVNPSNVVIVKGPREDDEMMIAFDGDRVVENLERCTDPALLAQIRAWAKLIANQPTDPRPPKKSRG